MSELSHLKGEETKPLSTSFNVSSSSQNDTKDDKKYNKDSSSSSQSSSVKLIFFFILSIILYLLSLKGCDGTQTYCLVTLNPSFFYLLGVYLSLCAIIIDCILIKAYNKEINRYHLVYIFATYIYLLYFHDTGGDLSKHGAYNRMVFYFMMIVYGIIIGFLLFLRSLYRNKRKYSLLMIFVLFASIVAFTMFELRYGCVKWKNGLNGMKIENDMTRDKCYIIHPHKCWVNMLDGIFDVSWIIQENCNNFRAGERQELIKYLPPRMKDTFNFAYPITTNYTWLNESHFDRFFNNVMRDVIDTDKDNYYNNAQQPEIFLKFNPISQFGEISMNIQRNEKIVKEREEIYKSLPKKNIPKYKNVLFIYIDALSRAHFMRKMKYTKAFINKFFNHKDPTKSSYQMMKYHAFIYFTPPNVNPMFYGESMLNSNGTNIIRAFKQRGFITGQSNNICSRELYDLEDDYTKDMDFEPFDHENIAMFCDPNFHNLENPFTPYLGPYSIKRRCLYGRDTFDYVLDYGEKFFDTYKNERKFLRVAFQDAHEGTGEVVRYLDERLGLFLESFHKKGYLDDTAVFFVSDHGNNMIGFYNVFQVEDFVMEKTLASWFMILPNKESKEEVESIIGNQQKMVTPYDIHDTLLYMIGFEEGSKYHSRYGQSVFKAVNAKERDCVRYKQDLKDTWCRCINYNFN